MTSLVENKKASYNYQIIDKIETGMVLSGQEVKALRQKKASLFGAYVTLRGEEVFLINCNVSPYQPKNAGKDYDAKRERKLLLRKKEINFLLGKTKERGISLIPLRIYTKNHLLKLEIGVGKGKKKYDKRETIKKREIDRDLQRMSRLNN